MDSAVRNDETVVRLHDILWYVLKSWKSILIFILAIGVLLGAYKGIITFRQKHAIDTLLGNGFKGEEVPSTDEGEIAVIYQPSGLTVRDGETADFYFASSGNIVGYYWRISKDKGLNWETLKTADFPNAKTNHLSFVASLDQDQYMFRGGITYKDEAGETKYMPTEDVTLTVVDASVSRLSVGDVVKNTVKSMAIGLLIGLFIGVVYVVLAFVLNGYLTNEIALRTRYDVPCIGVSPSNKNKGMARKIMDRLTYRPHIGRDESLDLIAANLHMRLGGEEEVLLVGTIPMSAIKSLAKELRVRLACKIVVGGNVIASAKAVNALAEGRKVVCVERVLDSKQTFVDFEMDTIRSSSSECVGFILVE